MKKAVLFLIIFLLTAFNCRNMFAGEEEGSAKETVMYTVKSGDTLARIAYKFYKDGKRYPVIAEANKIKNPHMIWAGSILVIPALPVEIPKEEVIVSSVPAVAAEPVAVSTVPFVWRIEVNNAFANNEKLRFEVAWKFIVVGYASMDIRGIDMLEDRFGYHIFTEARSAPFFDNFYKVRNTNESWMDVESLCSLKYVSDSHEKNFEGRETILYNQVNHTYCIVEKDRTGPIPPWVQDVLSALYYIRTKDIEVGKEYSMEAHSGDTSWPLMIKVVGREKIKVPAGEYDCFVLEPHIREGAGIFQAKGKLWVWVTADAKKTPVLMRSKIAIGSIEARLKSME